MSKFSLPSFREFLAEELEPNDPLQERIRNALMERLDRPFLDNTSLEESSGDTVKGLFQLAYSRNVKRVTLQRFLVTKIAYFKEEVTFQDALVLYDNLLWLQDKCEQDEAFCSKFGSDLESLAKHLKSLRFNERAFPKTIEKLSSKLRVELKGFLYPKRNYLQIQNRLRNAYQFRNYKALGKPIDQLPPKTYIGKGYRDKGTARDPGRDGSPSWQEVAMSNILQEKVL